MKWSIIQLQKFRDKGLTLDETVTLDELKTRDPEIRGVSPISIKGRADISSDRVTFHLNITGTLILPCSRTLVDVGYPININTTETFLLKSTDYEDFEEEEIHQVQGDVIDLKPVVLELLLLEVPMQVFSEEARDDDNLPSGKNWEVLTEDQLQQAEQEEEKKVDPRLADLAKLFEQDKNS
ncbi:YceD family protein [Rossellomorea sp. BNER]|uniref:YceD family protein n=1 Tax=Rossellomorea sp. BNER TaxID=2962031 RepID=UPI003AF2CAC1|nr:YceD family protein [Rossellomorea sp. BNER]